MIACNVCLCRVPIDLCRGCAVEPTQFGDDVAAEMRAYFDAHKNDRWRRGTADNLMLGMFNIAASAIEARSDATVKQGAAEGESASDAQSPTP